jgi:hypothetical protein
MAERLLAHGGGGYPRLVTLVTEATIVCPACKQATRETMATDACRYVFACRSCGVTSKPLPGDCCVFCSYADHACPPKQG